MLSWWLLAFFFFTAGVLGWWLLAPNTPRQDRRPCTHRKKFNFLLPFFVSTPVDQGVNQRFSPWTPSSLSATPRCAAEKEQGVQRANHGFALCPAGAGKGVSRNLKFRRRVQGPGGSCRGVLGARSHQLKTAEEIFPQFKQAHRKRADR